MLRVLKQIGQPLRTTSQAREPASVIVVPYLPPPEGLIYGKPQCGYPAPTCLRFPQFEKRLFGTVLHLLQTPFINYVLGLLPASLMLGFFHDKHILLLY